MQKVELTTPTLNENQRRLAESWVQFLNICDDDPPEKAMSEKVAKMLVLGGATSPKMASGLSSEEIAALPGYTELEMDAKLLVKLAVSVAKATVAAKHGVEWRELGLRQHPWAACWAVAKLQHRLPCFR